MLKNEVYNEIEKTFGLVPSMFKTIPDASLELEWKLNAKSSADWSTYVNGMQIDFDLPK